MYVQEGGRQIKTSELEPSSRSPTKNKQNLIVDGVEFRTMVSVPHNVRTNRTLLHWCQYHYRTVIIMGIR